MSKNGLTLSNSVLLDHNEIFSLSNTNEIDIDLLINEYNIKRKAIEDMFKFYKEKVSEIYDLEGYSIASKYLLLQIGCNDLEYALHVLDGEYWEQVIKIGGIEDFLPTKKRNELKYFLNSWKKEEIEKMSYNEKKDFVPIYPPMFNYDNLKTIMTDLLLSRHSFLAERVDDVFKSLSGDHITNSPSGFYKRMILNKIDNLPEIIHDLRYIVSLFLDQKIPKYSRNEYFLEYGIQNHGEWFYIDGNSIKMRCYLKGTVHLEVHPDMAWRLNCLLASKYPSALPPESRKPSTKKIKEFLMIKKPLSFELKMFINEFVKKSWQNKKINIDIIRTDLKCKPFVLRPKLTENNNAFLIEKSESKIINDDFFNILQLIGGTIFKKEHELTIKSILNKSTKIVYEWVEFDYDPINILKELGINGVVPDHRSHQFYPTPKNIVLDAIEAANIQYKDEILEPSAGTGNIISVLKERVNIKNITAIEIDNLFCMILKNRFMSLNIINDDFLKFKGKLYNKIIMNPPYSEGRYMAHLKHAMSLLKENGIIVAILPEGSQKKIENENLKYEIINKYNNEFKNTSINVYLIKIKK